MNPNQNQTSDFDPNKRIAAICDSCRTLIKFPTPLPPLRELFAYFERAIHHLEQNRFRSPYSQEAYDNQTRIEYLQTRLLSLKELAPYYPSEDPQKSQSSHSSSAPSAVNPPSPSHLSAEHFFAQSPTSPQKPPQNLTPPTQPTQPQTPPPVYTPDPNPTQTRPEPASAPTTPQPKPEPSPTSTRLAFASPLDEIFDIIRDPTAFAEAAAHIAQCEAEETARLHEEIAESINPLSEFDRLPDDQQKIIYELLQDYSAENVQKILSQPAPTGWALKSAVSSYTRFKRRYKKRDLARNKARASRIAAQVLSDQSATDADLDRATEQILKIRLLETINDPETENRHLRDLFQIKTRLRQLDLSEQRLHLAEQKSKPTIAPQ